MTKRETQKKREVHIEEEHDFYLSFVNKKLRNTKKKLDQIESLLTKDESTLKPEQIEKIRSKDEVLQSIKHLEELKDIYYSAYKLGLDEGKIAPSDRNSDIKSEKNEQAPEAPKVENVPKSEPVKESVNAEQIRNEAIAETLKKVADLLLVGQFFESEAARSEYLKQNQQPNLDATVSDLSALYRAAFNVNADEKTVSKNDKRDRIVSKLTEFVNTSQKNVSELVETVAQTDMTLPSTNEIKQAQPEPVPVPVPKATEEVAKEENVIYELLPGAAFLKPDADDINKSPENMKYLPKDIKTVKYVDELEREHMNGTQAEEKSSDNALKESSEAPSQNAKNTEEAGQEKSFRKNRSKNTEGNYTKKRQGGQGGNHKENRSGKDEGYSKKTTGKNDNYRKEYEVREYVPKKPVEKKVETA